MKLGKRITFALALVAMAGCTNNAPVAARVVDESGDKRSYDQVDSSNGAKPEQPLVAPSLCAPSENALFACAFEGSRNTVAICASKGVAETSGYLYYAYGTVERKKLIYPADRSPPNGRFKLTHLSYAGNSGGYAYSFENSGIKYIIYAISGAGGLSEHGVIVTPGNSREPLAILDCRPSTVIESDDEALNDVTLGWDEDASIAGQGLPARN